MSHADKVCLSINMAKVFNAVPTNNIKMYNVRRFIEHVKIEKNNCKTKTKGVPKLLIVLQKLLTQSFYVLSA